MKSIHPLLPLAVGLCVAFASPSPAKPPPVPSAAATPEKLMEQGVAALYTANDPAAAAVLFRRVIDAVPTHYGAHLQLAKALEAGGRHEDAMPTWKKVLEMSTEVGDEETQFSARLAMVEPELILLMDQGVRARLAQDFVVAEERFRHVLRLWPSHYGAAYQLAVVLDAAGRVSEATPMWRKIRESAIAAEDPKTLAAADARLIAKK